MKKVLRCKLHRWRKLLGSFVKVKKDKKKDKKEKKEAKGDATEDETPKIKKEKKKEKESKMSITDMLIRNPDPNCKPEMQWICETRFDTSKIPDVWDSIYWDLLHHRPVFPADLIAIGEKLFDHIHHLSSWVSCAEYGIHSNQKLKIGVDVTWRLLSKILGDLEFMLDEVDESGKTGSWTVWQDRNMGGGRFGDGTWSLMGKPATLALPGSLLAGLPPSLPRSTYADTNTGLPTVSSVNTQLSSNPGSLVNPPVERTSTNSVETPGQRHQSPAAQHPQIAATPVLPQLAPREPKPQLVPQPSPAQSHHDAIKELNHAADKSKPAVSGAITPAAEPVVIRNTKSQDSDFIKRTISMTSEASVKSRPAGGTSESPEQSIAGSENKKKRNLQNDTHHWYPRLQAEWASISGIKSTEGLRTRIYTTSASTMHSLLNVLAHQSIETGANLCEAANIQKFTDLNYMTHMVIRCYEKKKRDSTDEIPQEAVNEQSREFTDHSEFGRPQLPQEDPETPELKRESSSVKSIISPRAENNNLSGYRVEILLSDGVAPMKKVFDGSHEVLNDIPFIGKNILPEFCQVSPLVGLQDDISLEVMDNSLSEVLRTFGKDGGSSFNLNQQANVHSDSN